MHSICIRCIEAAAEPETGDHTYTPSLPLCAPQMEVDIWKAVRPNSVTTVFLLEIHAEERMPVAAR